MSNIKIRETDFSQILPFWEKYLWPKRVSEIRPISSMKLLGGYSLDIYNFAEPKFWLLFDKGDTVGGVSIINTDKAEARCRGIWIRPDYRGSGLSKVLFTQVYREALTRNCHTLWSSPRKEAWPAYSQFGFKKISPWISEGFEFSLNCYARIELKNGFSE